MSAGPKHCTENGSNEVQIIDNSREKSTKKKSRVFSDKETLLLISEWYKYPQLYNKQASEYHDRDKRVLAKEKMAKSLNKALGYDDNHEKWITGNFYGL